MKKQNKQECDGVNLFFGSILLFLVLSFIGAVVYSSVVFNYCYHVTDTVGESIACQRKLSMYRLLPKEFIKWTKSQN